MKGVGNISDGPEQVGGDSKKKNFASRSSALNSPHHLRRCVITNSTIEVGRTNRGHLEALSRHRKFFVESMLIVASPFVE